jgi:hypothetical protein
MAIHNQQEVSAGGGVKKGIEASSMKMILDNLQKYQYQFPVASTVRELISNAVDSVAEREVARKILSGEGKIEDFYVEREGEEFQDSKFDASYYDLQWLSDKTSVNITYIVGTASERDKVIIVDEGVGLGGHRLEKYFSLGYSTKRLSKVLLGKFGIGGKAALSTGEQYYTVESRYNGRLYRFNVYSHTFDSLIPAMNIDTGQENQFILFNEGTPDEYKVYWEPTMDKNGVKVIISAKKIHQKPYLNAVKSQLLYFNNVEFMLIENQLPQVIDFKANILYEDEYIILSDNQYWSQPHLLLNRVNYGYINFEELEMEPKKGNIGIKIAPEDVDINPSRESIIWSDMTKRMVMDRFAKVVEIASRFIQEELQEEDYVAWLRACYNISGRGLQSDDTIVGRLAKIVDLSDVKPSFLPEPKLKFSQTKVLNGLYVREVEVKKKVVANRRQFIVDRAERKTFSHGIINLPIFLMRKGERANNRKDKYLYQEYECPFLLVMEPLTTGLDLGAAGMSEETANALLADINKEGRELLNLSWEYLTKSASVTWYEEVEVPEDFTGTDNAIDEEDVVDPVLAAEKEKEERVRQAREEAIAKAQQARISAAERRKAQGKILIYTPRAVRVSSFIGTEAEPQKVYDWQKVEININEMNDWDAEEIYHAAGPEQDQLMHLAAMITRDPEPRNSIGNPVRRTSLIDDHGVAKISLAAWMAGFKKEKDAVRKLIDQHHVKEWDAMNCQHFYGTNQVMLVKTSIANTKYMGDFQSIYEFFSVIRNKTITMSNILIQWNTARIIKQKLPLMSFLWNFDTFNPEYAQLYKMLCDYVDQHYREVGDYKDKHFFGLDRSAYKDLISHLDKVQQFQEFVATNPTEQEVSEMAKYMFGNGSLTDGQAVNPQMMKIMTAVMDFVQAVGPMLNYMPILTGGLLPNTEYKKGDYREKNRIPMEFEQEVKAFLEVKGVLNYNDQTLQEFETQLQGHEPEEIRPPEKAVLITGNTDLERNEETGVEQVYQAKPSQPGDLSIPDDQAIYQQF